MYWNEENDTCLKFYKNIIDNIYKHNSSKKVKPGQKPFMSLDELLTIFKNLELYDEHFVERDVNIAFHLSKMLEIDEINSDKCVQLQLVEFYEALARIAEKASPPPFGACYVIYIFVHFREIFLIVWELCNLYILNWKDCVWFF